MSLYYKEGLQAHEHSPDTSAQYRYLEQERQWLLLNVGGLKIAFLRYKMSMLPTVMECEHQSKFILEFVIPI